ncbi:MAG: Ig-like domain-containing protein [Planctomycetota bacterium]
MAAGTSSAKVVSVDPAPGSQDVRLESLVSVSFSIPMLASSISDSSFQVLGPDGPVAGRITAGSRFARFEPDEELADDTTFEIALSTEIRDAGGSPLPERLVFEFRTVARVPFQIVSLSPVDHQSFVERDALVEVRFSEEVDPESVGDATLQVRGPSGIRISGDVRPIGPRVIFFPAEPFELETELEAEILGDVVSKRGEALEEGAVWSFETRPPLRIVSVSPAPDEMEVGLGKLLEVRFTTSIDPGTINASTFSVEDELGRSIPGAFEVDRHIVRFFNGFGRWQAARQYTVTVTDEIRDRDGFALEEGRVWSFRTLEGPFPPRAVYVSTSGTGATLVAAMHVQADGRLELHPNSPFSANGTGTTETLIDTAAICCDSRYLITSNAGSSDLSVLRLRGDDGLQLIASGIKTQGARPSAIALDPIHPRLYVSTFLGNTIDLFRYDEISGELMATGSNIATTDPRPFSALVAPGSDRVFSTFSSKGSLEVWQVIAGGQLLAEDFLPNATASLTGLVAAPGGQTLFAPDFASGDIHVFTAAPGQPVTVHPESPFAGRGTGAVDSAISADGSLLFVANRNSHNVSVFRIALDGAATELPGSPFTTLGSNPNALALSKSGELLYVANGSTRDVSVFSVSTDGVLQLIDAPRSYGLSRFASGIALSEF